MRSLSVDTIRREIGQSRDRLAFLHRDEMAVQEKVGELEAGLTVEKQRLEGLQAQIAHEHRVIEALGQAAAVLAERLPVQPEPMTEERRDQLVESVRSAHEPVGDDIQRQHEEAAAERAAARYVFERAAELDMTQVSDVQLERAELVCLILVEQGPLRQYQIADELVELIGEGCKRDTARKMVGDVLPVLVRQGRVQVAALPDHGSGVERFASWAATPAEVASGRLGTDVDNYAGSTTRWPTESDKPPVGSHIRVETSPVEMGKDR